MSVLTVSDAEFSRKLLVCDRSACLSIIKDCNAILRGGVLSDAQIHLLLRRQAKAERRLGELGALRGNDRQDYEAWRKRGER